MDWGDRTKAAAAAAAPDERAGGGEGFGGYVKVMTDEQMEVLRKQISIYATICEQLVEMHRVLTEHQDTIAGRSAQLHAKPIATLSALWSSSCLFCLLGFANGKLGRFLFFALGLALRLVSCQFHLCLFVRRKILSSFFPHDFSKVRILCLFMNKANCGVTGCYVC
jgi:hypothetical protein